MPEYNIEFTHSATRFYFNSPFASLKALAAPETSFIITDECLFRHYETTLKDWQTIVIPAGEASKSFATLEYITGQLIARDAGRNALIIGFGGGVVTDIAGFTAGIYKRGVRSAFIPTSLLAMVDAAVGGKNGIDTGKYKNMAGLIRQPEFLLYDYTLLDTLPATEWHNGFAEIIKHACIADAGMFAFLEKHHPGAFRDNRDLMKTLIQKNALLKAAVVQQDETEKGKRKLLNFGHTLAHAIETDCNLPHGHAVSLGIGFAAGLSQEKTGFRETDRIITLLSRYGLPVCDDFDKAQALQRMLADKKRNGDFIDFVLLERIGQAAIIPLSIPEIAACLTHYNDNEH